MTFNVERIEATKRCKSSELPLEALAIGYGFTVPGSMQDRFASYRMMVSRYNKRTGASIICNKLADGSLRIWNAGPQSSAPTSEASYVGIIDPALLASALESI